MKSLTRVLMAGAVALVAVAANAQRTTIPAGTEVNLVFDQSVSSKSVKVGDTIRLHVKDDVMVNGHTVLKEGTKVTGLISKVEKRKRYGINAQLRIALSPVRVRNGRSVTLEPRDKGKAVGGEKSTQAAAATAGGALILGPLGLAGGYFIVGKEVNIKQGDDLRTEVAKSVRL